MQDKRSSAALPALMALVILAVLLGAYAAGYFLLSTKLKGVIILDATLARPPAGIHRMFHHSWQAVIYQPAAYVESRVGGVPVHLHTYGLVNFGGVSFNVNVGN
jgi:hypothetical protein